MLSYRFAVKEDDHNLSGQLLMSFVSNFLYIYIYMLKEITADAVNSKNSKPMRQNV